MTTSKSSDTGFTIAEAADSLSIPKKTLRHVLGRPDRKARLTREYRNTKKGLVTVEIVPLDLYDELLASINSPQALDEPAPEPQAVDDTLEPAADETAAAEEPEAAGDLSTTHSREPALMHTEPLLPPDGRGADTVLIVATYERLLSEKEARLMDLRAALEAERENGRRLAEALAREQANHAAIAERMSVSAAPQSQPPASPSWLARLLGR